jgi:hypothetical protein
MDALIRYHFHLNTDLLNDEEFFELWAKLEWVLEQKQQANKPLTHG